MINHIAPPMMSSLFEICKNIHNMRHFQVFSNENRRTVNYCLETICCLETRAFSTGKSNARI